MIRTRASLCALLVLCLTALAWAGPVRHDSFSLTVDPNGNIAGGGGTGYDGGTWYTYPSGWVNQWFWNDPFNWNWKWIEFDIVWNSMIIADSNGSLLPSSLEIAINWSTPKWSLGGNPPSDPRLPPLPGTDEALFIHREIVAEGPFFFNPTGYHISGRIVIPNYNPEWVSIDVRGFNYQIAGKIDHQCVPLPSAAYGGLGLLGTLALCARRRAA